MATELSPSERDVVRMRLGLEDGVEMSVREVANVFGEQISDACKPTKGIRCWLVGSVAKDFVVILTNVSVYFPFFLRSFNSHSGYGKSSVQEASFPLCSSYAQAHFVP